MHCPPCDEECRIRDGVWSHTDMALFDEFCGLQQACWWIGDSEGGKKRTALTDSAILLMQTKTASRLRQKAATVSLFSMSLSLAWELSTPVSYSLERSCASMLARKGSWAGSMERRWAKDLREPQSLLYLEGAVSEQERREATYLW